MTPSELAQQHDLGLSMAEITWRAVPVLTEIRRLRAALKDRIGKAGPGALATALADLDQRAAAIEGSSRRSGPGGAPAPQVPAAATGNLGRVSGEAVSLLGDLEGSDMPPTAQAVAAARGVSANAAAAFEAWEKIKGSDLPTLNTQIKRAGLAIIELGN